MRAHSMHSRKAISLSRFASVLQQRFHISATASLAHSSSVFEFMGTTIKGLTLKVTKEKSASFLQPKATERFQTASEMGIA